VQCFDGLGRNLQKRTLVRAGSFQVSGFKQFNIAGGLWKDSQPYTASSETCDTSAPPTRYAEHFYDAAGRAVRVRKPDADIYGSASVVDTEYFPLRTVVHDELDTSSSNSDHTPDTPTTTEVDGLGRTVAIERMLQADKPMRTNIFYDELGGIAGTIDPAGNRKSQARDLLGRVTSVSDPDSGRSTFRYDAAGNVISRSDARGITVNTDYDAAGRKLAEWQNANDAATRISYEYDALDGCDQCSNLEGLVARISYPVSDDRSQRGEDLFGYDARSQPTYLARSIGGSRFEFTTAFDDAGRIVKSTYPAGLSLDFGHDGAGRLKSVSNYVSDVTYDDRGLLGTLALGNGVTSTYGYDGVERLKSIDAVHSSGTKVQQLSYIRDRVGNILGVTDYTASDDAPSSNAAYSYDALHRLTEAKLDPLGKHAETLQFAYDDIDNIVSKTSNKGAASRDHVGDYRYGQNGAGPHAVTAAGSRQLGYDAAGNLTTHGNDRFEWDFLGRMATAARDNQPVARFWYGATTERIKKTEQGQTTYYLTPDFEIRDGVAILYVRVGGQRVAKIETTRLTAAMLPDLAPVHVDGNSAVSDPDGTITAGDAWIAQARVAGVFTLNPAEPETVVEELLGASVRRLLGVPEANSRKVTYLHNDHLGSVVAVTDSNGKVVERRAQYPYGLERNDTMPLEVAYSFTGKELDRSTDLSYFGARYYSSLLGRWASPDPMFAVLSLSDGGEFDPEALRRFAYVLNNPLNLTDPNGFMSWGEFATRSFGVLQAVGAASQIVIGVAALAAPEPTGVTKVLGVIAILNGIDNLQAGIRTAWTGEPKSTLTEKVVESAALAMGASPTAAKWIGVGANATIGIVSSFGAAGGLARAAGAAGEGASILPRSGPIARSLGAMSRSEALARKLGMNVNSPTTRQVLNSLDMTVKDFVGQFRKGSVLREMPGEVLDMTIEKAVQFSSKVRKLLVDGRFAK
jgi:RHS repeat-associated protein